MRGKKRVSPKTIADRMRTVNKDFGVNTRGRPKTFVPKPITKQPSATKPDLEKFAEDFLKDDI